MDIWLSIKNEYSSFFLFSESQDNEWIYSWFSEKVEGLDKKLNDNVEIKISHEVIGNFLHDCLDILLDIEEYINENPTTIIPAFITSPLTINAIKHSAHNILKDVLRYSNENLHDAEYYLGIDLRE